MKIHIFTLILASLMTLISCEETTVINELPSTETSQIEEWQVLSNRIDWLYQAIDAGDLSPECRAEEIEALVTDIESWNTNPNTSNFGLSYNSQPLSGRVPTPPQEPCILLPCDPIRISNGWICFNTGTSGCDSQGRPVCTYVCIRTTGP